MFWQMLKGALVRQSRKMFMVAVTITHDPEVADQAERCVVLEHGRIARFKHNRC